MTDGHREKALDRDYIVVVGLQGMGKTVWTRQFLRGRPRVIILDPVGEYPGVLYDDDFDAMVDHVADNKVFQIRTNRDDWLPHVVKLARAVPNITLVLEEASRVIPPWQELPPEFLDVIYRGRHTGTSLVLVAQRAATINIHARSQWTRLITFRQTEANDVRWIANVTSVDVDSTNESVNLTKLPRLHYYDVTLNATEKKVLAIPRSRQKPVT